MLSLNNCYLLPESRLDMVVKKGNVVGFTVKDSEDKTIIPINDLFLYLEELPQKRNDSTFIEFAGVAYLPYVNAFVFCLVNINMIFKNCQVNIIFDSYNEKLFKFNSFVEPNRVVPYVYVINDNCDFPNGNELGNISLFNVKTGHICSIGQDIKNQFDKSPLTILNVRLVTGEENIHRLEIVIGDKKTFREWDTIYMGLKVISDHKGINYQVCNNFYNKTPKENGYFLNPKLASDTFISKKTFLANFVHSECIKNIEAEVNNYYVRRLKK